MFLLGFAFRTLGAAASSGTLEAYVFDFLKQTDREDQFEKILGRGEAFRAAGMSIAIAAGGFISEVSYSLATTLSAMSIILISVIALFMPEVPVRIRDESASYARFVRDATRFAFGHPTILRVIVFLTLVYAVMMGIEEFNDVYLNFLNYSN